MYKPGNFIKPPPVFRYTTSATNIRKTYRYEPFTFFFLNIKMSFSAFLIHKYLSQCIKTLFMRKKNIIFRQKMSAPCFFPQISALYVRRYYFIPRYLNV